MTRIRNNQTSLNLTYHNRALIKVKIRIWASTRVSTRVNLIIKVVILKIGMPIQITAILWGQPHSAMRAKLEAKIKAAYQEPLA